MHNHQRMTQVQKCFQYGRCHDDLLHWGVLGMTAEAARGTLTFPAHLPPGRLHLVLTTAHHQGHEKGRKPRGPPGDQKGKHYPKEVDKKKVRT